MENIISFLSYKHEIINLLSHVCKKENKYLLLNFNFLYQKAPLRNFLDIEKYLYFSKVNNKMVDQSTC